MEHYSKQYQKLSDTALFKARVNRIKALQRSLIQTSAKLNPIYLEQMASIRWLRKKCRAHNTLYKSFLEIP